MRHLSDADVDAIVSALTARHHAIPCRFSDIDPKVMEQALLFYSNWNESWADSKKMARRAVTALILVFLLGVFWNGLTAGISAKMQSILALFK